MKSKLLFVFLPFIATLLLTGCTGTKSTTPAGEVTSQQTFSRAVNPFPVYGAEGERLDHPFLGGYNTPRAQFVDIDGDGDPDLFVQENSNELIYFEYDSAGADGSPLEWQTDQFQGLDIGEWFRFADMDHDGDYDLLAEEPYSYIRYYRNEGTPGNPSFALAVDTLKDVRGEPIFSDRQNIPNVTDIDCDNRLDLFIGRLNGTVMRYESTGLDERGIPQFQLVSKRFEGIEIVKQFGTLHGANTLAFYDIDHDNDQDLFWGDFFEPSLLLIENRGSCGNPELQGEPEPFPLSNPVASSGYNAPAFADWGLDGDIDLFVGVLGGAYNANSTTAENFHFYEQTENGSFILRTRKFLESIDTGTESIPDAGDIDGDGDQDLLVANKIDPRNQNTSLVFVYENRDMNGGKPSFHLADTLDLPNAYHYAPALGDLDGDGLPDLLLGNWKGSIAYYRNTGGSFEPVNQQLVDLERGSNSSPALADIDNDGDLDLFVGESGGGLRFFRNEGSGSHPEFVLRKNAFPGVRVQNRSVPELHDIDGDGDLDLFMGTKLDGLKFFRNNGSPGEAAFEAESLPVPLEVYRYSAPLFTDLDGDQKTEFISGGEGGGLIYYNER